MLFTLTLLLLLPFVPVTLLYVRLPKFGQAPTGARLERIRQSPHFRNGAFHNQSPTPSLSEGETYVSVLRRFLFTKKERPAPAGPLPSHKTDLRALRPDENVLVWFGHSSYFLQVDGRRILVDPVFSGAASPLRFTTPSFPGSDVYTVDDLPDIDYLFLSHDHWDHLDYQTVTQLKPKVGRVVCGLGTGAHLERWGYDPALIVEKDWHETEVLEAGWTVHTTPARHFSGRAFKRNGALWLSFVLQTPTLRLFLGGDSGYDGHFAEIGAQHGPFDLVILECGQYDNAWKYIHLMPEEVPQAAQDLRARRLLPVHWAKFQLANHAWDDPMVRARAASQALGMPILHPLIGEKVDLNNEAQEFRAWWEGL